MGCFLPRSEILDSTVRPEGGCARQRKPSPGSEAWDSALHGRTGAGGRRLGDHGEQLRTRGRATGGRVSGVLPRSGLVQGRASAGIDPFPFGMKDSNSSSA